MNEQKPALLLRDFVNTLDVQCDDDEIATPEKLSEWLRRQGLLTAPPRSRSAAGDAGTVATAAGLREGLRAAMLGHHRPGVPEPPPELDEALARLPLRLAFGGAGEPTLVPVHGGIDGGLGRVAAAVMACLADGSWTRLKVCQEDTCRWAFLDTSKNRSRAWCSMRVCGNRTKTRAYRARRRPGTGSLPGA